MPILLVFIALAHGSVADETTLALTLVAKELGIGAVVGLVVASFAIAQSLHGSGYIAAFGGGMLFGFIAKSAIHKNVKTPI